MDVMKVELQRPIFPERRVGGSAPPPAQDPEPDTVTLEKPIPSSEITSPAGSGRPVSCLPPQMHLTMKIAGSDLQEWGAELHRDPANKPDTGDMSLLHLGVNVSADLVPSLGNRTFAYIPTTELESIRHEETIMFALASPKNNPSLSEQVKFALGEPQDRPLAQGAGDGRAGAGAQRGDEPIPAF